MMEDKIVIGKDNSKTFDMMQIALAIRNSTYDHNFGCSLIEEKIISGCKSCSLKEICETIEKVAKEYTERTTKVLNTFSF